MTHATRIELGNYGRFKGNHELKLETGVYAITARLESDDARSNWLGKTTLLNVLPHVLHGHHNWPIEDAWISKGEAIAMAALDLSDGTKATITRKRGKKSQLIVIANDGRRLADDQAREELVRVVGLSKRDSFATWLFPQKKMSQFATMDPADRMAIVSDWLELEEPRVAISRGMDAVNEKAEAHEKLTARVNTLTAELLAMLEPPAQVTGEVVSGLEAEHAAARAALEKAKAALASATKQAAPADVKAIQARAQQEAEEASTRKKAEEFDRIEAEGAALRAKLDALPAIEPPKAEKLASQREALGRLNAELAQVTRLAEGKFDGTCPVIGIDCPAKDRINGDCAAAREKKQRIAEEKGDVLPNLAKLETLNREATERRIDRGNIEARLAGLAERAKALWPAKKWAKAHPPVEAPQAPVNAPEQADPVALASDAVSDRAAELEAARVNLAEGRRLATELDAARTARTALEGELALSRAAVQCWRTGLKVAATGPLGRIESLASSVLADAGIDLSVKMSWARAAATGLATHCENCGWPFPASQKVKACGRCTTARGPKLVEKLELLVSDVSGAAEDLGGIAVQLAASSYLRGRRGAPWATACLDEPTSAMDRALRSAFGVRLVAMLTGRFGFEQCFVVSHAQEVIDSLPKRIEIVAGPQWSRFA